MPLIQFLLYHIPTFLLGFFIVAFYVSSTVIGLIIIRKFYPYKRCKDHNDIAGFIFATLGVIYAVILAFTVIVTWEQFERANDVTDKEAEYLASLHRDAIAFPDEFRERTRSEMTNYINAIINDEWHAMRRGKESREAGERLNNLFALYSVFHPKNETQKVFFAESVSKLNYAGELRRQRLLFAGMGIHPILYVVLFAGGFITIGYTMIFGTENFTEHLIMVSCLAAIIALTIFTIIALDYPFTGKYSIQPDVFTKILASLSDQ